MIFVGSTEPGVRTEEGDRVDEGGLPRVLQPHPEGDVRGPWHIPVLSASAVCASQLCRVELQGERFVAQSHAHR